MVVLFDLSYTANLGISKSKDTFLSKFVPKSEQGWTLSVIN